MFYVYEWYLVDTGEVFYVGKGTRGRYRQTRKRNQLFNEYYRKNRCDVRIVKTFDNEDDALAYERVRITRLKNDGLAKCNLDNGGTGGCHFSWSQEMRDYKSLYNPMKNDEQRARMSRSNPIQRDDVKQRVSRSLGKSVVINGVEFYSIKEASRQLNHTEGTIAKWCRRGYDADGKPCRFSNEQQKEIPTLARNHPKATSPKAVIVDGIYFDTVSDAAKHFGTWSETIIRAIKQNRKFKNHTCEYANQQPRQGNSELVPCKAQRLTGEDGYQ